MNKHGRKKRFTSYHYVLERKRRKKQKRKDLREKNRKRGLMEPAPNPGSTDALCEITEHKGTEAGKFLKRKGKTVIDVLHAPKNNEIDSLGIDLILFLPSPLFFPFQVKASTKLLKPHYRKYYYICAVAVGSGTQVEELASEFEQTVHSHAKRFFELKSCIPYPDWVFKKNPKDDWAWPHPTLVALKEKSPLVASYHEANRHNGDAPGKNELRSLGFTGVVFFRNGFGLFIRRESPGLPPPQFPGLTIPSGLTQEGEAELIVRAIGTSAKKLRW